MTRPQYHDALMSFYVLFLFNAVCVLYCQCLVSPSEYIPEYIHE